MRRCLALMLAVLALSACTSRGDIDPLLQPPQLIETDEESDESS